MSPGSKKLIKFKNNMKNIYVDFKQVINKHLSHEDDIDVGKDEQIVEIERKLSMRMRSMLKRMRIRMTLTL